MSGRSNPKLLIVDDEPKACELTKRLLKDSYDIELAYCGEEAIAKIYNFNPVVILLDVNMPRLTGDELVKMIKAWRPEIQTIMVSGVLTQEIKTECMQNGAFDCLGKPLDYKIIKETIQKALS
jgi:DNA-binding NtrC family response regulator